MTITAIITFFIILFVLVIVHELGHFIFAKMTGMRVDEFAFGFPPRLFSKKIGETNYSFNLIPLGGYVKIFGENGEENKIARSFSSKSPFARILVLLGGVLFNILAAILLFTFSFMSSDLKSISAEDAISIPFSERKILVGSIDDKSSFSKNPFFQIGTEILSVGTNKVDILKENLTSKSIADFVQVNNNSIIRIEYKTTVEGETVNKIIEAVPQPGIVDGKKILGLGFADVANKKYTFVEALKAGTTFTFSSLKMFFTELYKLPQKIYSGKEKIQNTLSGPIGIAMLTNKFVKEGFSQVLYLAAMLSITLAAFNILPIPALDGGRILFVFLEIIFRRKISAKVEQSFHSIGFLLLICLMFFVTYFDILKII